MNEPVDSSLYEYSLVFYLQGIERRFDYAVSFETSKRVRELLEEEHAGNLVFEAYGPAEQVVINSRFMQMAHFRWLPKQAGEKCDGAEEAGPGGGEDDRNDETGAEGAPRDDAIRLYFIGRESPVRVVAEEPEEVFDLVLALQTEAFPRCSLVDSEGEEAVIDIRKLACAEFPLGLAQRGEAQALFEIRDEV